MENNVALKPRYSGIECDSLFRKLKILRWRLGPHYFGQGAIPLVT